MKKFPFLALCPVAVFLGAFPAGAAITAVVETNGDNEATDTITAKYTGQTFAVSVAGEPVPGSTVGTNYTVGNFASLAPAYVDRNHRWIDAGIDLAATPPRPIAHPVPSYLAGQQYIMSGNDNRDNATYMLDITINSPSRVYLLIDNRLSDTVNTTPPTFDATHMQWVTTQAWLPRTTGRNRTGSLLVPDEVAIDEGADNTINQYLSVYYKDFAAGTFRLLQPDNAGNDMYGVVIGPVPEPGTLALFGIGLAGIFRRRRS